MAIPRDYNNSKLRVCKYIPIAEYKFAEGELKDVLFKISEENPNVRSSSNTYDDQNDWDWEEDEED